MDKTEEILNKHLPFNPLAQPVTKEYRLFYRAALNAMEDYHKHRVELTEQLANQIKNLYKTE